MKFDFLINRNINYRGNYRIMKGKSDNYLMRQQHACFVGMKFVNELMCYVPLENLSSWYAYVDDAKNDISCELETSSVFLTCLSNFFD